MALLPLLSSLDCLFGCCPDINQLLYSGLNWSRQICGQLNISAKHNTMRRHARTLLWRGVVIQFHLCQIVRPIIRVVMYKRAEHLADAPDCPFTLPIRLRVVSGRHIQCGAHVALEKRLP